MKCPACGSRKSQPVGEDYYKCTTCGGFFDDDPDEGGDYGSKPSARIERQERNRSNRDRSIGGRTGRNRRQF